MHQDSDAANAQLQISEEDSDAANAQLQISEEAGMLYDPTAKPWPLPQPLPAVIQTRNRVVYRHASAPLLLGTRLGAHLRHDRGLSVPP